MSKQKSETTTVVPTREEPLESLDRHTLTGHQLPDWQHEGVMRQLEVGDTHVIESVIIAAKMGDRKADKALREYIAEQMDQHRELTAQLHAYAIYAILL